MTAADDRLPALYADLERIGSEAARWAEVEASDSTALVHVGSSDPVKVREQMIAVRREARSKSKELRAAAEKVKGEVEAILNREKAEMEARMKAAMAALAPLQEQVKRMEEGIWTVSLYLGSKEEIVTLRSGQPAAIDAPIHMRTQVLAMDEEVASFPEDETVEGGVDWQGMDYRDLESFDRWLVEDPEHLAQVLPEERGIVVFTPRRTSKNYDENPFVNAGMNEPNFESYWLIRNGENLYRLSTDFKVGSNLMPVASEFTALFQRERRNWDTGQYEMVAVEPGTREWEQAEQAQDGKRKHYMRVALIVQGLIDRTEVLAPLHAMVNVMSQRTYDDGFVVVIDDTDNALGTSREPYYKWIRRLNADLRPGMRIIGHFGYGFEEERIHPRTAKRPPSDTLLTIEDRREHWGEKGLVVRYPRGTVYDPNLWVESETRPGWGHRGGDRPSRQRASAVILPNDVNVIPYDLVTVDEMQAYLDARTERHAYADSFPLLQAAIKAKRAEVEAERPFRDLLTGVLATDTGQDVDEVAPHIDGLVHRFKLGNKWHRPLVSMSAEDEAKALRLIRAEYARIVNSGANDERDAAAVAALRKHDPDVMFVGRLSSGKYVAFAPMPREHGEAVSHPSLWVREHVTGKTARSIKTREWITPGNRGSKMVALFETDRWTGWDRVSDGSHDLTDPEMHRLLARALHPYGERLIMAVEYRRDKRTFITHVLDGPMEVKYHGGGVPYTEMHRSWERDGDGDAILNGTRPKSEDFDLGYMGNWGLGTIFLAHQRQVFMPWQTTDNKNYGSFTGEKRGRVNKPGVLFSIDDEQIAVIAKWVQDCEALADEHRFIDMDVNNALRSIDRRQVAARIEEMKAEFLADYPDEEMWDEKREALTKGVKPAIETWDNDYRSWSRSSDTTLRRVLTDISHAGHRDLAGLTVRDAYRLADVEFPSDYAPIENMLLIDPDAPVADER